MGAIPICLQDRNSTNCTVIGRIIQTERLNIRRLILRRRIWSARSAGRKLEDARCAGVTLPVRHFFCRSGELVSAWAQRLSYGERPAGGPAPRNYSTSPPWLGLISMIRRTTLAVLGAALCTSTTAAHPGHGVEPQGESLLHYAVEPVHAAMWVAAVAVVWLVIRRLQLNRVH